MGHVPTTAYLIAQHTSYEYQMMSEMKLKQALFGKLGEGFPVGVQMRKVRVLFNNNNFY